MMSVLLVWVWLLTLLPTLMAVRSLVVVVLVVGMWYGVNIGGVVDGRVV